MRIDSIRTYTITSMYAPQGKTSTTITRNKITTEQYHKPSNEPLLKAHSVFFTSVFLNKENFVKNIFRNKKDVMNELRKIIFSTKIGNTVGDEFNYLSSKNRIEIGLTDEELGGYLRYEMDDVNNSKIFLRGDQTINMMASTLIHELRHFKDLLHSAKNREYFTLFDFEVNAFADKYELLNEVNYTNSKEYQGLTKDSKDLLEYSKKYVYKNNINNIGLTKYLGELLTKIGYDKEKLYSRIIPKAIETVATNNTISLSTLDFLKARSNER